MLTRRSLFATAGGLILAGCAARSGSSSGSGTGTGTGTATGGSTAGSLPDVGPNPAWNGTALSGVGGTAPTDPTRTTAKPAACFLTAGEQRLWQDIVLGVDADALGGIAWVEFFGDCVTTRVTARSVHSYTDPTGTVQNLVGYFINLKASLFFGAHDAGSEARIFARIHANDATMQERIIGNPQTFAPLFKTDWPMRLFPRSTESDFSKTIGSGGNYPDLVSFINAARAANAEAPKGTFITTGFYEATSIGGNTGTTNAKGFMVLTHATGVKATIRRAAPFDPETPANNNWRIGWHGVEFLGLGVIIDSRNFSNFISNKSCWFNGCRRTNSIGYPASAYYWNGSPPPSIGVVDDTGNGLYGWHTDGIYEFLGNDMAFNYLCSGLKIRRCLGSPFDGGHFVFNTYGEDLDTEIIHTPHNTATIVSTAGNAKLTINRPGEGPGTTMVLSDVNGTQTITFGATPAAGNLLVSDVAAVVNARPGWTMTVTAPTLGARFLSQTTSAGVPITNLSVTTAQTLQVWFAWHTEWFHNQNGNTLSENFLIRGNITRRARWGTGIFNGGDPIQDAIVKGNAWECLNVADAQGTFDRGGNSGFGTVKHSVVANNYIDGCWSFFGTADAYSLFAQNLTDFTDPDAGTRGGAFPTTFPLIKDNALTPGGGQGFPSGTNAVANFKLGTGAAPNDTDFQGAITSKSAGNFIPNPSGVLVLAGNKRTAIDLYDGRGNPRNMAGDAIGPWAIGYTAPDYSKLFAA